MNTLHKYCLVFVLYVISHCTVANTEAGLLAMEQGKIQDAIKLFESADSDFRAQLGLAQIYMEINQDEAEEWINKAVKQQPDHAEAQYTKGIIMANQAQNSIFSALGYAKKSKKAFARAVMLEPQSIKYLTGLFGFNVGAPSIAGGDLEEAALLVDKIAEIDPVEGIMAKIDLAVANEELKLAHDLLESGVQQFKQNADLAYHAGMFYQDLENFEQALVWFEKASELAVDSDKVTQFAAIYQLGRTSVLGKLNQKRGIQALESFLENAPSHPDLAEKPWVEFRLAQLYEQDGDVNKAKIIYKRLVKTDDKRLRKKVKRQM